MTKPKIKIFVMMHGGCIEGVFTDSDEIDITDIVFLEDESYGQYQDDEFHVLDPDGTESSDIIYTHHSDYAVIPPEYVDRIMAAAQRRSEARA